MQTQRIEAAAARMAAAGWEGEAAAEGAIEWAKATGMEDPRGNADAIANWIEDEAKEWEDNPE